MEGHSLAFPAEVLEFCRILANVLRRSQSNGPAVDGWGDPRRNGRSARKTPAWTEAGEDEPGTTDGPTDKEEKT